MHFTARYSYGKSCVFPSVTLVDCDHIQAEVVATDHCTAVRTSMNDCQVDENIRQFSIHSFLLCRCK